MYKQPPIAKQIAVNAERMVLYLLSLNILLTQSRAIIQVRINVRVTGTIKASISSSPLPITAFTRSIRPIRTIAKANATATEINTVFFLSDFLIIGKDSKAPPRLTTKPKIN